MGGDLEMAAAGGKVHYKVTGAAPNRVLTVEFLNMSIVYNGTAADGTYQVRLHETTGQIEFVYGAMNRNSATWPGREWLAYRELALPPQRRPMPS